MTDLKKEHYDVIIIGAGIGGLICGCYLAKAGKKVLIVEKNDQPGGCCVSFKRKGFRFDAGAHIIGSCNEGGVLNRLLKNLNVRQKFMQLNPTDRFFFLGDKIEVSVKIDKYILMLQEYFPKEKNNISAFFEELVKIAVGVKIGSKKYANLTYQKFLDSYFQDIKLKAILSAQSGYLGLAVNEVSTAAMCAMLSSYLKDGAYYPLGGAGSLANALALQFKHFGGRLMLKHNASKIIIKNNKATGIVIDNKDEIHSDIIVSNSDIKQTFFELLDGNLAGVVVKENIDKSHETPSLFTLYLGLKIDKKLIEDKVGWHYPDYNVDNLSGCMYITSPSLYDDTATRGGKSIIEVFELFPYRYDAVKDWKACKAGCEEKLLDRLETIIPGIKKSIIVKESSTPKTIKNYTANANGAPYGWALVPGQYERNDIISNSVMPYNLYLTGHWVNPGGGIVAVAVSGYSTAMKIISSL